MSKEQESLTRTENKRQKQRSKKSKVDKILNILIAIVSILIVLNVITIFNDKDDDKKEQANEEVEKQSVNKNKDIEDTNSEQSEKNVASAEEIELDESESEDNTDSESDSKVIIQTSNDPGVEEVIINPQWEVTPTKQVGEHVSAYEKGHPDYEEKLATFQQAVQLAENDIIYWSVKNNGSTNSSVAVVSTNDKSQYYRIYIEWMENEGWKPTKVEKLNQAVGIR
ncbi:MAG TPA: YrrS family protein [Ureibacillus sp.]|nr:YrrS family protein [Ureibacillus sp.]